MVELYDWWGMMRCAEGLESEAGCKERGPESVALVHHSHVRKINERSNKKL